jgi:hypothetical protein
VFLESGGGCQGDPGRCDPGAGSGPGKFADQWGSPGVCSGALGAFQSSALVELWPGRCTGWYSLECGW